MSRLSSSDRRGGGLDTDMARLRETADKLSAISGKSASSAAEETVSCEYLGIHKMPVSLARSILGDTRVVLMCGPPSRAIQMADLVQSSFKSAEVSQIGESEHFTVLKIGPVVVASHGMGKTSCLILCNEVWSLLRVAVPSAVRSAKALSFVRVGSSGGVGVDGGTIVVSTETVNPESLKSEWIYHACGVRMVQQCKVDLDMAQTLYYCAKARGAKVEMGKTMAADTYYECQARLDGALCEFDEAAQSRYLHSLRDAGVRNIEMEGTTICGFCSRHGVRFAMACVAYLNRLEGQTVPKLHTKEDLRSWMQNLLQVAVALAAKQVAKSLKAVPITKPLP